ncbi:GH1 family beta-glucosidase [Streptomyces sp. NPDC048643]|uniref:GH1 family beta-glucosidase n=1 Tax=Streptomyces sp. NPDC048643 TaxID=3155637 RepID=UPI00341A0B0A
MPQPPFPQPDRARLLPENFRFGVATSAFQIEGAPTADGRSDSIWDTFCRVPGAVAAGDTGDLACDHYRRMPEDVDLLAGLGVDTYRFSVSWPRVQPGGRGPASRAGLDFYDRLVDRLLAKGVDPWLTLYHWDLPQELEDAGGWPHRDTAHRFADYAALVFDRLGDRVHAWTTLNEPWCVAMYGYADGMHAPGRRDRRAALHAVHHLLLGHGEAVRRMQEQAGPEHDFGLTLNLTPSLPATDSSEDVAAARRADGLGIRLYLDPILLGTYPEDVVSDLAEEGITLPVQDGDLDIIATSIDVLGVNYYFSERIAAGRPVREEDGPVTALGWPVTPDGLTDLLLRVSREYPAVPLVITENGGAFTDATLEEGRVCDGDRIAFLAAHIDAVAEAHVQGVDVRGYFVWTLLDNFEWAHGYGPTFGLVSVDRKTMARTPKESARWFRDFLRAQRQPQV